MIKILLPQMKVSYICIYFIPITRFSFLRGFWLQEWCHSCFRCKINIKIIIPGMYSDFLCSSFTFQLIVNSFSRQWCLRMFSCSSHDDLLLHQLPNRGNLWFPWINWAHMKIPGKFMKRINKWRKYNVKWSLEITHWAINEKHLCRETTTFS